ncbi:MAG: glutamate--tRNA ligase [Flavobacteriales bacterium]
MTETAPRVRFAPSPTGPLHMGGVRTALYNHLFARKHGGVFVLRLEDTDRTRFVEGAEDYILEALDWSGIRVDEGFREGGSFGPYRQSERKESYREYAERLVEAGFAYYAFDTAEDLEAMREQARASKAKVVQYDAITRNSMRNSLTLSDDQVEALFAEGAPYVIRLKVPRNEEVRFFDRIRGWVVVHTSNLDDKVLFKSDGMPTYHLANVVDDHRMAISHVIRGEEWLPSAPVHVLLYRYLGWEEEMPEFAHLPLLLKPDGDGKLSKRDGARLGVPVFPLKWDDPEEGRFEGYRENGYFPEAFINMLALLGWNPGTEQEIFTPEELVEAFSLDRVGKAGAKFDVEKTRWFQQQHLRLRSDEDLAEFLMPLLEEEGVRTDKAMVRQVCRIMKERATFVSDMLEGIYFFRRPDSYDEKTVRKKWKGDTASIIRELRSVLDAIEDFRAEAIEEAFRGFLEEKGYGFGKVMPNLRVLLTGKGAGPSIFEIASIIGKEETLARIDEGLEELEDRHERTT